MDGLKELVEAFSARIKSPIIGSIALAFIVINWRPVFFLFFSGEPTNSKFVHFTENTSGLSLYLYPVIVGLAFALLVPWINFWGAKAIESPVSKHRNLQLDAAHALAEKKTRQAIDMETVSAEYRRILLESAKVDQEIKDAEIDEDVRAGLQDKISGTPMPAPSSKPLSNDEDVEITALAKVLILQIGRNRSGSFDVSDFQDKHEIKLSAGQVLTLKGREQYLEALEAIKNLQKLGYVDGDGTSGKITKEGYDYINSVQSKDT